MALFVVGASLVSIFFTDGYLESVMGFCFFAGCFAFGYYYRRSKDKYYDLEDQDVREMYVLDNPEDRARAEEELEKRRARNEALDKLQR